MVPLFKIIISTNEGTAEERGLTKWQSHQPQNRKLTDEEGKTGGASPAADESVDVEVNNLGPLSLSARSDECTTYDIPFITPWLKRFVFLFFSSLQFYD